MTCIFPCTPLAAEIYRKSFRFSRPTIRILSPAYIKGPSPACVGVAPIAILMLFVSKTSVAAANGLADVGQVNSVDGSDCAVSVDVNKVVTPILPIVLNTLIARPPYSMLCYVPFVYGVNIVMQVVHLHQYTAQYPSLYS